MDKKKVLFVCVHNSARSQMAESYLKQIAGDKYEVESAGLTAGVLNPLAIRVMSEEGIDISHNRTKSAFDLFKQGKTYDYVITVCDKEAAEQCPVFPGFVKRHHWGFTDPSTAQGSDQEKMAQARSIRDAIKDRVRIFVEEEK